MHAPRAVFLCSCLTLALLTGTPATIRAQAVDDFTVLRDFSAFGDGTTPQSGLTLGSDGNFYGTTYYGGAGGNGTISSSPPMGCRPPCTASARARGRTPSAG